MSISGVSESKLNYNRMKKRHLGKFATVAVAICLGFASCKQIYYQVYDVDSKALTRQDNSLVYENSDLKLMYNLGGIMALWDLSSRTRLIKTCLST